MFSLHHIDYAIRAFDGLMEAINENSRHVFYLHRKRCSKISTYEMAIIHLIAFIQDDDYQNAESLINDFITSDGQNIFNGRSFYPS
jgi:hypothetical protein